MRPPPEDLPSARSRTWHSRRMWDGLGYLRVRSLANPKWSRDVVWLTQFLVRDSSYAFGLETLYARAIEAARRYPRTAAGAHDSDGAWDEVLAAIDEILVLRQRRHLESVRIVRERLENHE